MTITTERTTAGLPGIQLPGRTAAPRPDRLLTPGSVLLAGAGPGQRVDITAHRTIWGRQPEASLAQLIAAAQAVALRGAGGAGFPTARKLDSVAGRKVAAVIVNGTEGESASAKDGVLLLHAPHLVLDGAAAVARATRCRRIIVRLAGDRPHVIKAVRSAIAEHGDGGLRYEVSVGAGAFVGGEATAVINALHGDTDVPADLGRPPKTPRKGLRGGIHVFLSNVETFARLAAASRGDRRPTSLITVSGAVANPGVMEIDPSVTLDQAARSVGLVGAPRLVITGGWHGAWTHWDQIRHARMNHDDISSAGGRWGAGAFVFVPDDVDPRSVLAAITHEMAGGSAGQCGPCMFGLPALAGALDRSARSGAGASARELGDLVVSVEGRGLCAHPTATAAAVRSGLAAIDEYERTGA